MRAEVLKKEHPKSYACWLQYEPVHNSNLKTEYKSYLETITLYGEGEILQTAVLELQSGIQAMLGFESEIKTEENMRNGIVIGTAEAIDPHLLPEKIQSLKTDGFFIEDITGKDSSRLLLVGQSEKGVLYGVFHLLRQLQRRRSLKGMSIVENPVNELRMINHWDNMDGSIERGYAGNSIFYHDYQITEDKERIQDYARLLASVGINAISINNVNVHPEAMHLITEKYLGEVANIAAIFRAYGIKLFLSVSFASPIFIGKLDSADPYDEKVRQWWKDQVKIIYQHVPDFGGFLVKADSEGQPGPFEYGRNHVDGANMLAEALEPFGGIVIWRCFVYNHKQDWRDRSTDRARAAYDHFKPLDGQFLPNVILQIKNGPMDFQVREPVSPLFGAMEKTNQMMEFQITQEYTGQQKHLFYLVPMWKEVLEFDTYAKGEGSFVKKIVAGSLFNFKHSGIAGVVNVGSDYNWTGHTLAQANLYGYGRLTWNPDLTSEEIAEEWIEQTFGHDKEVIAKIKEMLLKSPEIYENYTAPLGVGWMVNPHHHYGPNVDGYEYSQWGTYHFADWQGIGVDRTVKTGTGYTAQYHEPNASMYESLETCPDELLLFFHHVPYTHRLKSGKTVIQHIYDTHFEGVEQAQWLKETWESLEGKIDKERFKDVLERLEIQVEHAKEWRDVINTYFYRKSGIDDEKGRKIYR